MHIKFTLTILFVTLLSAAAGAQNNTNVVFTFHHKAGAEPMQVQQSLFSIWNGKTTRLDRAAFYISEIDLVKADSSLLRLQDVYLLVDAGSTSNVYPAGTWDVNEVIGVNLHLGVDSAHNHLDPSTYPEEHPLAHQKIPMHWGWVAGYRFMAIEGYIDNNNDGVPESPLEFHNIGDNLYKNVKIGGVERAENGKLNIHIELDYARLFDNMPMSDNLIEHGSSNANHQMMENAASQGFLKMINVSATGPTPDVAGEAMVSPNPAIAHTLLRYNFPGAESLTLAVVNSQGQIIRQWTELTASGAVPFDATQAPNGVYYCLFYQKNHLLAQQRFVIQH